ncbi:hypothetical protein SALWKB29_1338 [Snodgrassella communis]|uniref:Uncharacterized protein n=1 Tax=Snodgrassella communis TaxID=2946699 RepID=A0A836MQU0_9NEIS|nr:hypothetical protein SALWKB29_1338 [Snodgrassella communis]
MLTEFNRPYHACKHCRYNYCAFLKPASGKFAMNYLHNNQYSS